MTDKQKTKIYVVTKGSYSDYHIITATTDKELANEIAKKFDEEWLETDVEVYEDAEIMLKPLYWVEFDGKGDICAVKDESDYEYAYGDVNEYRPYHKRHPSYGGGYVYVTADNADHAVKIANEKRAEFLAKKAGIV